MEAHPIEITFILIIHMKNSKGHPARQHLVAEECQKGRVEGNLQADLCEAGVLLTPGQNQTDSMYTPTLLIQKVYLPKFLDLRKFPVVSLDSDMKLRHWRFSRWIKHIKTPRKTEILDRPKLATKPTNKEIQ